MRVRDPKKLEAIKVGDPVVGKYYEALAFEVKKPGTATPGVTAQQGVGTLAAGGDTGGRRRAADHRHRDDHGHRQEGAHGDDQGSGRDHGNREGAGSEEPGRGERG